MKKRVFTVFTHMAVMAACICGFYSCAGDDEQQAISPGESSVLEVTAGIHATGGILKAGPVAAFGEGSALGLFLTKGNPGDDYDSPAASRNIKSTFSNGGWTQAPAVNLYAHPATVYACYPYSQNNAASDGTDIPVGSGFTDHMYGTHTPGQQAINKDNRTVHLTMNHALALVQFELYKQDYLWTGDLTAIRITNAPGKAFVHMNGRMNVATGQITSLSGADMAIQLSSTSLGIIPNIPSANEASFQKLLLLPTGKTDADGDILVTFIIDGRDYIWEVPAGTQWQQGTKNTYRVLLKGNTLQLASVTVTDWRDGIFGDVILE